MKLSDMIARLEELKQEHGDLEVWIDSGADSDRLEVIHADTESLYGTIMLQMWDDM